MSGRGRRGGAAKAENHERWLLTYADMLTLLVALFICMFAVASVDEDKFKQLSIGLQQAFTGKVLTGGGSIREDGGGGGDTKTPLAAAAAIAPMTPDAIKDEELPSQARAAAAARREENELQALKRRLDARIREKGLGRRVETTVERRGLVVRVITDDILFASGEAVLQPQGRDLIALVGQVLRLDDKHPITVDGHTDTVPISTGRYPDNWELSAARATSVVRVLAGESIPGDRLSATGHGSEDPRRSNASAWGRSRNRRVEIALTRLQNGTTSIVPSTNPTS